MTEGMSNRDREFLVKLFLYSSKKSDYEIYITSGITLLMTYLGFLLGLLSSNKFLLTANIFAKPDGYPFLFLGLIFLVLAVREWKLAKGIKEELKKCLTDIQT